MKHIEAITKFKKGDRVHIDSDQPEWGRVCSDGIILSAGNSTYLVEAESIRANVLVQKKEMRLQRG